MGNYSTGLELILNACEGVLQIAITDNEQPLCFEEWFAPQRATELLAASIQGICARLGIDPASFKRIGCMAGPGSFTGIRLVLSTAAALRRASRAQLASLDYLQSLATTAVCHRQLLYPGEIYVLTHARRNLVHFQKFVSFGPQIPAQMLEEARLVSPESALEIIGDNKCLVCGSAIARYPHIFSQPVTSQGPDGAPNSILMPEIVRPSLIALRMLARHGDYFPRDVDPKYVRPCDAIENLKKADSKKAASLQNILEKNPESDI